MTRGHASNYGLTLVAGLDTSIRESCHTVLADIRITSEIKAAQEGGSEGGVKRGRVERDPDDDDDNCSALRFSYTFW